MIKAWVFLTALVLCSASFVFAQTTPKQTTEGGFSGEVKSRCTFKAPSTDQVTYLQVDTDSKDGFIDTFQANGEGRKLMFTYLCNGVEADITFSHPQKVSGPNLYPDTFYTTTLSTASNPDAILSSGASTKARTARLVASSTPQSIYFSSIIYNGGVNKMTGRIPLLAGVYKFVLQATIAAGM